MYDVADAQLKLPGVLSNSIVLGFPYADVEEMGSAFIVVTDNDQALAQRLADELGRYLHEHRREFVGQFISIEEAIDLALNSPQPACLLDMGDNVGGGSAADGTLIAHAVHRRGGPRTFVAICDPKAVEQARDAGVGRKLTMSIGGKVDDQHGPPLVAPVTVMGIYDGHLHEPEARHGGKTHFDMGPTAILQTDTGLTIQVTTHRTMPFTINQVTSCRLDPRSFAILVAKGVQAPVAAYKPVCPTIIRVNTPGSTTADMISLRYEHRRKPLYPFEEI
jgi:microcystin degradation protein MlrC